jgi:hypothetical protein
MFSLNEKGSDIGRGSGIRAGKSHCWLGNEGAEVVYPRIKMKTAAHKYS